MVPTVFRSFVAWLRRPPKRELIIEVLAAAREPLLGREIAKRAGLGFVGPYTELAQLREEGLVDSKDAAPEYSIRFGEREIRMQVYWLTDKGHRARREAADREAAKAMGGAVHAY